MRSGAERSGVLGAIDVALTPALAGDRDPAALTVVIDTLRATSTIVTALENGAAAVIPVRDSEEAIAVRRRLGRDDTLLGGEQNSLLIPGFDLDNSPRAYVPDVVAGKTIVLTTTNGTRALVDAARNPRAEVLCGALLNRAALAEALASRDVAEALLVCAGSRGAASFEDVFTAGAIVDAVLRIDRHCQPTDAARVAHAVWQHNHKRITTALASGSHAKHLIAAGFAEDIAACARLDASHCLPSYTDGKITKL